MKSINNHSAFLRGAAIALVLSLTACMKPFDHKLKVGDFVESGLDGRRGQVVMMYEYWDGVVVRFAAKQSYSPLLGGEVSTEPYATVTMAEWELKKAK